MNRFTLKSDTIPFIQNSFTKYSKFNTHCRKISLKLYFILSLYKGKNFENISSFAVKSLGSEPWSAHSSDAANVTRRNRGVKRD